ncbi:hypothetical protein PSACC_03718 [Paramicrosporidium saccamoebae]|uniref:Uncharacterized protein n=1 Tax=Paramicrosporidium saccamoebae TaxID=1246581 RepID=A0A2H9TFF3_9FUNG|nr:hypothetical protein PSACC_03718 [Paramicrosporidium saccamoebae]
MLPEFDLIQFEGSMLKLKEETAGAARKQASQLKMTAYKEIFGGVLSVFAAIFAITMRQIGHPIVGAL